MFINKEHFLFKMDLISILTKNNVNIIKLLCKENLHIRDIADKLNYSPSSVHKLIQNLKKYNAIEEIKQKNRLIIKLNNNNTIINEIKRIINFNDLINSKSYKKLKSFGKIGVYGSFAKGTNDLGSDIDLWLLTKKSELELRPLLRQLGLDLGYKVNILILSEKKIKQIKNEDYEFYIRLKLTSIGDDFD
jgi:predicted DNA-binding protein YlxM (UPF0122 family)